MYGFEWKDQRGVEGIGFVRALRSLLTAHLPSLLPSLSASIVEGLESEVSLCKKRNGMSDEAGLSADILSPKARCFLRSYFSDDQASGNACQLPHFLWSRAL